VVRPADDRPLVKQRTMNIKMDFKEVGWRGMDCNDMAENRDRCRAVVNAVMKLRFL
jgi:hypothetical protein